MNTEMHAGGQRRRLWIGPTVVTVVFLLIPLLGNFFVDGWNWSPGAFVRFGAIVFGFGLAYELVTRNHNAIVYRSAVVVALATAFLLFWGNFVQFVDVNRAAVLYFAALIVGIVGAVIARLRPAGMARALFATAIAQASILAVALIIRDPHVTPWTPAVLRGFGGNAFFALLFVVSALLFRKEARRELASAGA